MKQIFIDGALVDSQVQLHNSLAAALEFPVYYGKNLDALWDCLSDYAISLGGDEIELVIKNSNHVREVVGADYFQKILACFSEARDEWKVHLNIILA